MRPLHYLKRISYIYSIKRDAPARLSYVAVHNSVKYTELVRTKTNALSIGINIEKFLQVIFDHDSIASLIRELNRNSQLRMICGFQPHILKMLLEYYDGH